MILDHHYFHYFQESPNLWVDLSKLKKNEKKLIKSQFSDTNSANALYQKTQVNMQKSRLFC
ncbi:hypothetical protein C7B76_22565 [filamentous cyanobacterium CCP2]|nr:hypothetical protein C7B76_22565 [filamentous cyanobacterium CCP2]